MLYIEKVRLKEMIAAVESIPEESCGFLFGHETRNDRAITMTMVAENATPFDKYCRYEIAPLEYLKAEHFAEQNNLKLLGIYHSHPNQVAIPSEHDRSAAQPYFSYVIISIINKKFAAIRSWRLNNGFQFAEEEIIYNNIYQSTKINGHRIHSNTAA